MLRGTKNVNLPQLPITPDRRTIFHADYHSVRPSISATNPRIARMSAATSRRLAIAAAPYRPCLRALALPIREPGDFPPCIRHRPFATAGVPLRVRAPQRALRRMGMGARLCMGLFLRFAALPTPGLSTVPTTACPPGRTWTCSTVTICRLARAVWERSVAYSR